mgnify:CR=1 FL=1
MNIKDFLVKFLKFFYKIYRLPERKRIKRDLKKLPNFRLKQENIESCQNVLNRLDLIKNMPKGGIVAELGVDRGNFSEIILRNCNPKELHLIDIWDSPNYNTAKYESVVNKFKTAIQKKEVYINKKLSTIAANDYKDEFFDWIYIDTDHSYETTLKELYAWQTKIKKDGYILGHDYISGSFIEGHRYGVMEAVTEFCVKEKFKLAIITLDYVENNSFAIKRI